MINFYRQYFVVYYQNQEVYRMAVSFLADETDYKVKGTEKTPITWNNISGIYNKYEMFLPFNVWNLKKGRKICWFYSPSSKLPKTIKQWKVSDPELSFQWLPATITDISLNDLMKRPNSELVIKYLIERGMNVINGGK